MHLTALDLLLLALATQRLTSLWFEEFSSPVRNRMIQRGGRWEYFARCPLCVSMWAAGLATLCYALPYGRWFLYVPVLSMGAMVFDSAMQYLVAITVRAKAEARLAHLQGQAPPADWHPEGVAR